MNPMRIELRNRDLKGILGRFMKVLFDTDRANYPYVQNGYITPDYACGDEYLKHMQGKKADGFPEKTNGVDLGRFTIPQKSLQDATVKLDEELIAWSGSRNNAVKMLYPKGGYMGWHTNANAPGYNLLLSWSETGAGYFKYQDLDDGKMVIAQDNPGWTCKVGYFGNFQEPDKMLWHCANAEHEERVTLGYIIPHEGLWRSMWEDIQSE